MRLVEIEALENGAHRNQTTSTPVILPDGWAVIPDDMVCENFPFGSFDVEEIDGVPTVLNWIPGEIPEPEPEPDPVNPPPTLSERVSNLEQAMDALLGGDA